jgi:hypothetical protein
MKKITSACGMIKCCIKNQPKLKDGSNLCDLKVVICGELVVNLCFTHFCSSFNPM